jgi:erythromycin esterase
VDRKADFEIRYSNSAGATIMKLFNATILLLSLLLSACASSQTTNQVSGIETQAKTGIITPGFELASTLTTSPISIIEDPETSAKITWLKENALQLRSISPIDDNFSDLEPLKQIIGDKRIIMLGEESHGDGNTFLAKIRLIKFLHQEMGFDVLAFESGFYDCHKAWEMIQNGDNTKTAFNGSVGNIWSESSQVEPLMSYLDQMAITEHPLILTGFDSQFTGTISPRYLIDDLTTFLKKYPMVAPEGQEWNDWVDQTRHLIGMYEPPSSDAQELYLNETKTLIENIKLVARPDDREAAYWLQLLKSMDAQAEFYWKTAGKSDDYLNSHPEISDLRDIQMGQNLIWLANEYYTDKKIIVWAATYHIARNLGSIEGHLNITTMGDVVWKELGDQVYALGFTAYTGRFGIVGQSTQPLSPPSENSLEDLMYKANFSYAIIDFRHPTNNGDWLQEKIISRPLGYQEYGANWTEVLDGIMFIKEMIPSTR